MAPAAKQHSKRKGPRPDKTTVMFPSLHEDVVNALSESGIAFHTWFNNKEIDKTMMEYYLTFVMGRFDCRNRKCPQDGWSSKKIAISIQRFPNFGYNAIVYKQRCKVCDKLGTLRLNENSYIERVAYRLKRWAGVPMEDSVNPLSVLMQPQVGPPHMSEFCEGCKAGRCHG